MPTMKQRRGTKSQWSSADPVLAAGEIGVELGTGSSTGIDRFKIGNGLSKWSELKYFLGEGEINLDFSRLSEEALDSRYVQNELVETGRLSSAELDRSYAKVSDLEDFGDMLYAPQGLFSRTYVPQGTTSDRASLQAVIDEWAASGLPGFIRIGAGTLKLTEPTEATSRPGALRIPANKPPLLIEGAGAGTNVVLSPSVPRFFDLYSVGAGNLFKDIAVRGFSVDGGGFDHTYAQTTVTLDVTLVANQYTAVSVSDNSQFRTAGTRWVAAPLGDSGSAAGSRMLSTLPAGKTTINLFNSSGSDKTLKSGDLLTGYLYDHVILGNNNVGSTSGTGQNITNVLVEDITATNIATHFVEGLSTFSPHHRFALYISPGIGGYATNIWYRNVRVTGGECGLSVSGPRNSWIDNVHMLDCYHDTGVLPSINSGSLNYLVGQFSFLGRVRIENCEGHNSADVGIEIDQAIHATVSDCLMVESFSADYYITNFVPPARSSSGPQTAVLTADLTAAATTLAMAVPSAWPRRGYARINNEVIYYQVASTTSLNIIRGMDGSVAAAASTGTSVVAVEIEMQRNIYSRCRGIHLKTPGKLFWANANYSLPMQTIVVRDCSVRQVVTDLASTLAFFTTGFVCGVDIDGLNIEIQLANTVAQPGTVYSAFRLYRPGAEVGRNSSYGRPTNVRIAKLSCIIAGSVAASSSIMRPVWVGEGWYDLDVQAEIINYATGFSNGGTSGVFVGGSTMALLAKALLALRYISASTSDSTPHIFYMNGTVGITDRVYLEVDLTEAYVTTNQIPWNVPPALRDQIIPKRILAPRLSNNINAVEPVKTVAVSSSPYSARHSDRVLLVGMASAVATINLPATNAGNALAVPRPGAGTLLTIKDVSGSATTYAITINAASGETIDGAPSRQVNVNYGVITLLSTGTGWVVV